MLKNRRLIAAGIVVLAVLVLGTAVFQSVIPGLSIATREPPRFEVAVATWLLHRSVPDSATQMANPLAKEPAAIAAGQDLFRAKCEACHAYDGSGHTAVGAGQYPRPPGLRALVAAMADGEVFYHVKNGIRNTGMPAWPLPDEQIWQLVSYMRNFPVTAGMSVEAAQSPVVGAHYVGSAACKSCHEDMYARWSKTKMANVVRDPKEHPDAIIPDLSKPDPLVDFTKDDIAFVYGSTWKQRYFKKVGDDYFPLGAQWDVAHKLWRKYFVADNTDWWVPFYPKDNMQRPTGALCDGCHSVNYKIETKTPTEWNVGCERCHGPGSAHAEHPTRSNILNPAHLDYVAANDTCIQCHSQGRPRKDPINGKHYDWPVGYEVGLKLQDFWQIEEHKLGETTFTHFADGTGHKNRMQGNDFVQSLMYARGVTCFSCHDVHGTGHEADLRKPATEICLTCHGPNNQNGPRAASIEAHTHHQAGSAGSECVACHMPKIAQTIADTNVRSHTFRFVKPAATEALKIPNACATCHNDKDAAWATKALSTWTDHSPWRIAN